MDTFPLVLGMLILIVLAAILVIAWLLYRQPPREAQTQVQARNAALPLPRRSPEPAATAPLPRPATAAEAPPRDPAADATAPLPRPAAPLEGVAPPVDAATLNALHLQLQQEAGALDDAIAALRRHPRLSVAWNDPAGINATAMTLFQQDAAALDQAGLAREMERARRLAGDLEASRNELALVQAQHTALCTLLERPELAERPGWYQGFQQLAVRAGSAADPAITRLVGDAEALIGRRRALLPAPETPGGPIRISATDLPRLLAEAQAIRRDVQTLVQHARELAAARKMKNEKV
jgi:hypothetical protein